MKRLGKIQKKRQLQLAKKRYRRQLKRKTKGWKLKNKRHKFRNRFQATKTDKTIKKDFINLVVPNLNLFDNYEETVDFIANINEIVFLKHHKVNLLFNNTENIDPASMLCLVAEIYRCRKSSRNMKVTGTYPNNEKLEVELQKTGFFNLLGIQNRPKANPPKHLLYIQFITGVKAVGEKAKELEKALFGDSIKANESARTQLYRGLTEAMTNVVQHAYPPKSKLKNAMKDRWWMVGHIDNEEKHIMVMFFDQGVGIPATLPKNFPEFIKTIISGGDGDMICAAMKLGRSASQSNHRGKGLNDLRALIDQCGGSALRIVSRKGRYDYAGGKENTHNYSKSIGGTLIEWKIPLASITNLENNTNR